MSRYHRKIIRTFTRLSFAALLTMFGASAAFAADEEIPPFANPQRFMYRDGEHLYRAICQGCHMADGKGAQGAGAYPALAANPRLAAGLERAAIPRASCPSWDRTYERSRPRSRYSRRK